jgi:hypothetical protein
VATELKFKRRFLTKTAVKMQADLLRVTNSKYGNANSNFFWQMAIVE